jgi:hypothetical protein
MSGPGEYRPDPTEGIARPEDLPQGEGRPAKSQLQASAVPALRQELLPRQGLHPHAP